MHVENYHKVSGGSVEPLNYGIVRDHLRLDDNPDEEDLITEYVKAARELFEERTGYIITDAQTWQLHLDEWFYEVEIKRAPIISITSIQYYDDANVLRTLDPSRYYTSIFGPIGRIRINDRSFLPTLENRPGAVIINFTAGHGSPASVSSIAKQALLVLIADMYENRQDSVIMPGVGVASIPHSFINLSDKFKIWK